MGHQVRGISHGVALPAYFDDLSGHERRNALARWHRERRSSTHPARCLRCGNEQPYTDFPQIRVHLRQSGHTCTRRAVICAACTRAEHPIWAPRWERLNDAERTYAEGVRSWVAAAWSEEPGWINVGRAPDVAEARAVVGAILIRCYGWGPTHTGYALGQDHSTVLHHISKLDAGDAPAVADMLTDYQREHRTRKAGA
jgi:hypothetical protein